MRNLFKILSIVFIIIMLPFTVTAQKKHYSIVDTIAIKNMENCSKKFDIEYFEENKDDETLEFVKDDGTKIKQSLSGYGYYVERETPALPKFYTIYREFYLNGNLKTEGILLRGGLAVSIWRTYDEQGNVTEEDVDKEYGAFDYNKVFLFLDKKGHINLKTGRGRDEYTIGFDKENHCWDVNIWPQESNNYKGFEYLLDIDTGKVKKQGKILPSGS